MSPKRLDVCPRCQGTLFHTGGFWECANCALAVTDPALRADLNSGSSQSVQAVPDVHLGMKAAG